MVDTLEAIIQRGAPPAVRRHQQAKKSVTRREQRQRGAGVEARREWRVEDQASAILERDAKRIASRWGALLGLTLTTCACAGPTKQVKRSAIPQSGRLCAQLRETNQRYRKLLPPAQTRVNARLAEVKAARQRGARRQAERLAETLAADCQEEARSREDVASLVQDLWQERANLPPELYRRFQRLVRGGFYDDAIACGESLLLDRSDFAPDRDRICPVAGRAKRRRMVIAAPADAWEESDERTQIDSVGDMDVQIGAATQAGNFKDGGPTSYRGWAWTTAGISAAALIGGTVLAVLANQRHSDLEEYCPERCTQGDIDTGSNLALGADILFGVGAAAAVASLVLFLIEPDHEETSGQASLVPDFTLSPTGAGARWSF